MTKTFEIRLERKLTSYQDGTFTIEANSAEEAEEEARKMPWAVCASWEEFDDDEDYDLKAVEELNSPTALQGSDLTTK